ncbi:Protein kinase, catalytic domain-containing protein [Cynara cardunculus var. scolymus]|uniref:Protein kinase, catalytic domain-containing protein n=1 Tax=Cynara cardunculus var. scolymus TaxID=59895 RepID=A0A103YAI5_CYNCS|nr:Protein kinase, catalytic domain-containing protein [Cynara cardunculus var. scolymus]
MCRVHEAKLVEEIVDKISYELFSNKDRVKMGTDHLKIPLEDILLATNEFAEANIIARTGFGKVYKGQSIRLGIVAIKKLDRTYGQGDREFMMEIALLSMCKHENIVTLVGFCDEGGEKILVYRYEQNGSLDRLLRSKDLTWMHRLRICLGAAFGLKYLHDDVGPQCRVLHRDVKSANILLDENWKPKISDFGLSKIALSNVPLSALVSNPCGTQGYIDPQYIGHSTLTQKSDVYSFGVVLLEVLFGRAVTVAEHPDKNHFSVKMAKSHYEEKTLEKIIDADLRKQMKSGSLSTFSAIAYKCLKEHGEERPRMIQVIEQLVKALEYQQDV